MAVIKIDLPGWGRAHTAYHEERGTRCNHDCMFYEEQPAIRFEQLRLLARMGAVLQERCSFGGLPDDPEEMEEIRREVYG
jgi:hypothetical protein